LSDEVHHAPVLDIDRHLVQQLQVVDGGIIRLHVGSEDEVIVRQMIADVSDSVFGTAMALHVCATTRYGEIFGQHQRQRLENKCVP